MVVFVVVAGACSVFTRDGVTGSAKQLNLWLFQQSSCVMHGVRVTTALLFFVLLASSVLYVLLLIPRSSREIWGLNLSNLPEVFRVECLLLAFVLLALQQLMLL